MASDLVTRLRDRGDPLSVEAAAKIERDQRRMIEQKRSIAGERKRRQALIACCNSASALAQEKTNGR